MHHLRHRGMVRSLKLSSLFFVLRTISAITFFGLLIFYFVFEIEMRYEVILAPISLTALFSIFNLVSATKCRCQLCQASMMLPLRCTKNSKARPFFGSYRLRIALGVLFKDSYRCTACGEHFSCMPPPADYSGSAAIDQASFNHRARKMTTIRRSSKMLPKRK